MKPSTLLLTWVLSTQLALAQDASEATIPIKAMADALHLVIESDRTVYTQQVVNRLVQQDKVIKASEHFKDDKALPLPAQMLRMGAEHAQKRAKEQGLNFAYSLQSLWPINKQNAPKTQAEKDGLKYVAEHPEENFYTTEVLGGVPYFTAVYADKAVAPVCIACHNAHPDSPRRDFKLGEVMGGIVVRIPVKP